MKKKYLGYMFITQEMGSEGYGGYSNYAICEGSTPEEVVKDYIGKFANDDYHKGWDPKKAHVNNDGIISYHDYFTTYFIELPDDNVYLPKRLTITTID